MKCLLYTEFIAPVDDVVHRDAVFYRNNTWTSTVTDQSESGIRAVVQTHSWLYSSSVQSLLQLKSER